MPKVNLLRKITIFASAALLSIAFLSGCLATPGALTSESGSSGGPTRTHFDENTGLSFVIPAGWIDEPLTPDQAAGSFIWIIKPVDDGASRICILGEETSIQLADLTSESIEQTIESMYLDWKTSQLDAIGLGGYDYWFISGRGIADTEAAGLIDYYAVYLITVQNGTGYFFSLGYPVYTDALTADSYNDAFIQLVESATYS